MAVKSSLRLLSRGFRFRSLIDWFAETFHCFFSLVSFVIYRFTAWSWETTQNILYESCWLILTGLLRVLSEYLIRYRGSFVTWVLNLHSRSLSVQQIQWCCVKGRRCDQIASIRWSRLELEMWSPLRVWRGRTVWMFSAGLYCVSKLLESRMKWWSVGNISVQRLVFDKLLNVWLVLTLCVVFPPLSGSSSSPTPSETCTCLNSFSPVLLY